MREVRGWGLVAVLTATETVSWGVLYYAFAVLMVPMSRDLGWSLAELTAGFSLALMTSALAGIPVGLWLDRQPPRRLMTAGSALGAALVIAWSQVESLLAFYLVWVGIGVAMAAVLYQPAFTVLTKWFPSHRREALTVLTLVAATASFIFSPVASQLVDAGGWRHAALVLGIALAAFTVPLHLLLPGRRRPPSGTRADANAVSARAALRSAGFWFFTGVFCLEMVATTAATVLFIPATLEHGHPMSFAALAAGAIGVSALPGRAIYAKLAEVLPERWLLAGIFGSTALSIALLLASATRAPIIASAVVLGASSGMATLAFATGVGDRYGTASYGVIGAASSLFLTTARAAAPVSAGLLAGLSLDVALCGAAATGAAAAGLASRLDRDRGRRALRARAVAPASAGESA